MSAPKPGPPPTAEQRAEALDAELAATRLELWRSRAIRRHPQLDGLDDFLTGDDEAAILANADRLAAKLVRA